MKSVKCAVVGLVALLCAHCGVFNKVVEDPKTPAVINDAHTLLQCILKNRKLPPLEIAKACGGSILDIEETLTAVNKTGACY